MSVPVRIVVLPNGEGLPLPSYATEGAAGCDLRAAIQQDWSLDPGERGVVPCGIAIELPDGFEAQVRPRSGLASKHGITVINSPGTIDSDYRGEIKVPIVNLGTQVFVIRRGERIAQMVVAPVVRASFEVVASLSDSARGTGGFGSTGR